MKRLLFLLAFIFPSIALAAPATYNLLAPLGTLSGAVTLSDYLQGIVQVIIGVAGVLAVIMIVICAIQMIGSPSVSQKSASKECITNALFGLLLAIGSWILLSTINTDLLKSDFNLAALSTPVAPAPAAPTSDPMPTNPGYYYRYDSGSGIIKNSPPYDTAPICDQLMKKAQSEGVTISQTCFNVPKPTTSIGGGSETSTRTALCANAPSSCTAACKAQCLFTKPLGTNNSPCVPSTINGVENHCTNVAGLPGGTVSFLVGLPSACSCNVIITGGTENGHASHGANIPVFDLSKSVTLYNFIKTNASIKANPSFCKSHGGTCHQKWLYNGYWFTDEDSKHWHVCKDGTTAPAGKSVTLFKKACTQI